MIAHLKEREQALGAFGLTGRLAEWIALASLHGGVFTRAQLSDWLGASRFKVLRLVQAWTERRLVTEETVRGLKVCRVCARGIYRALGAEDIRHRRITSTEVVVRRLLSFDYVIEHPGLPWLPTEPEKVGAFEALGIQRSLLPVRVYRGAAGGARRYFPRGMPLALDSRRAVFVHADPGYDTSTALHSWRDRHRRLWEALREDGLSVEAVGVACARRPHDRARRSSGTGPMRTRPRVPCIRPGPSPRPGARPHGSRMPSGAWTTRRSRNWAVSTAAFAASSRCGNWSVRRVQKARSAAIRYGVRAAFPESGFERRGAEPVADPEV